MKVGDKVIRTGEDKNGVKKGQVYTVSAIDYDMIYLKEIGNVLGYDKKKFKVVRALPDWF